MVFQILRVAGSLGLFLFGMKMLSESVRRAAGERLRAALQFITANRPAAIITGFVLTVLVQSSSASTVMIVGFVNAGLLTLAQSIGAIMGANIGTTVTGWIVAVLGFKVDIGALALPAIAVGAVLVFSKRLRSNDLGNAIIGFGLLFLGLAYLKDSVPNVGEHPQLLEWIGSLSRFGPVSVVLFVIVGTALTVVVQSSSAAVAITLTMAYAGWIDYPMAAAIILGENIGTTVTANLAAIGGSRNGKRAARAHLLFNVFGVLWMLAVFMPFLHVIDWMIPGSVFGAETQTVMPTHLAMFHTVFNVVNTLLCAWFIPTIVRLVNRVVPGEDPQDFDRYTLPVAPQYAIQTPELYLGEVRAQLAIMTTISQDIMRRAWQVLRSGRHDPTEELAALHAREEYTDQMQQQISNLLAGFSAGTLNTTTAATITVMLRIVDELESAADSGFNIAILSDRRWKKKINVPDEAIAEIDQLVSVVDAFLTFIAEHLRVRTTGIDLERAMVLEANVNKMRNQLKKAARKRIQKGSDVRGELVVIDAVGHLEHIADHCLSVAECARQMYPIGKKQSGDGSTAVPPAPERNAVTAK